MRGRLDRSKCVICGRPPAWYTGYIYYQTGATKLYAPFCKENLDKAPEYANSIFENQTAADLFRQSFPVTYLRDVKDKPILFFDSHKTANSQSS